MFWNVKKGQNFCLALHRNDKMKSNGLKFKNIDTKKSKLKFNEHSRIWIPNSKQDLRVTLLQGDYC